MPCRTVEDGAQVAQVVGIAEAILTFGRLAVGAPVIVESDAIVVGQDAFGSRPDMPAFGMDVVVGQFLCAGRVQPEQPLGDTHTVLIEMDDRRSNQLLVNRGQTSLGATGKSVGGGEYRRLRRRIHVKGSQQISDSDQRD